MIRKIKYLPFVFFLLLLYGCPDSDKLEDLSFNIENETNVNLKASIFNINDNKELAGFGIPVESNFDIGYPITENYLRYFEDYVPHAFSGDSAVIVLGDRYLIHKYDQMNKVFTPDEKNIFRISSYTQETPTIYRMELNQEDYDNATPCNDDPICGE